MDQLKRIYASLTVLQRVSILVATLAVIGGLFYFKRQSTEQDFKPLFSNLSQEDAAAVLVKVKEAGSEYRLSENGTSVLIPSAKVAEMRLQLASVGIPKSGRIGYELFDKTDLMTTDFGEQLKYHRALEGELERSVMSLSEVEQARVHLTFPKDSVFTDLRQPAKASVMVKLKPGSRLTPQNVSAVCQLTASAVEGLSPESISVIDSHGNLLSPPKRPASPDSPEPDDKTLEYKSRIERELLAKINRTLEPLLGAESFRADVSVDCDFSSGEQSEETYDPSKSVMANSQKTEDVNEKSNVSGIPGTPSNLPRPTAKSAASGGANITRRTENISYQSSRMIRKMRLPQGNVKRMSVGILVDALVRFEGVGPRAKRIIEPASPERMKAIHDVVAGIIGFSTERGDQLIVESQPFESTLKISPPGAPAPSQAPTSADKPADWIQNALKNRLLLLTGAGAGIALAALVYFLVWKRMRRKVQRGPEIQAQLEEEGSRGEKTIEQDPQKKMEAQLAEQAAEKERQEVEALQSLKLAPVQTKKAEVLTRHINEEAKKDPKIMAQIVRAWMHESRKE